ncbi:MAG: sortase [Anaerolineaceae bacterium]
MKNVLNHNKELLVLILGGLLLFGGIVGILVIFIPSGNGLLEQTPVPTDVQVIPTQLSVQNNIPEVVSTTSYSTLPNSTKDAATPSLQPLTNVFSQLQLNKYYVHADAKTGLEKPLIPDRIVIPSVGIDAKVVIAGYNSTKIDGETFGQWEAPSQFAAGWQPDSALLGKPGNTVINGHHNEFGEVFGKLVDVKIGDKVFVYANGQEFTFIISNRMILQERYVSTETRLENARWLATSDDTRLTLVTCWPKISNTHRLILVARPDF